jgi:uncharacterized protein (DUF433 family)
MDNIALYNIEKTPGTCGGKPRIAGTRMKVSLIASLSERNRMTPDEIVEAYPHLTLAQVHSALAYYWSHREEIEQEIREEQTFLAEFEKQLSQNSVRSPSPA